MDDYVPEILSGYLLITILICAVLLSAAGIVADLCYRLLVSGLATLRPFAFGQDLAIPLIKLLAFTFPIALTAYVAGYLSTMSRTTAVGAVLPAALTLIGGLNIYIFGSDTKYRVLVSYCVCVFVLMLFYGSQYGGYLREATREYRLRQLSVQEAHIRILRANLGLPEDFPSWVISSEPK
jgi:hypothetical protein